MGRIYQQTFVDTYSRIATVKLCTEKTAITSADILNDRVIPFFTEHNIRLTRILTRIFHKASKTYSLKRDNKEL